MVFYQFSEGVLVKQPYISSQTTCAYFSIYLGRSQGCMQSSCIIKGYQHQRKCSTPDIYKNGGHVSKDVGAGDNYGELTFSTGNQITATQSSKQLSWMIKLEMSLVQMKER